MTAPLPVRAITSALIVEDTPVFAAEARAIVAAFGAVACVQAATLAEGRAAVAQRRFDLALVDVGLPDGSGIALVREVTQAQAGSERPTLCVIRTVFDDDQQVVHALAAGAHGYLLKGEPVAVVQERLAAVVRGEPVISPAIARRVLSEFALARGGVALRPTGDASGAADVSLTPREHEVLQQVSSGFTVPETARALGVSDNTVKTHLKGIYGKLGVRTRLGAVAAARGRGLLGGLP